MEVIDKEHKQQIDRALELASFIHANQGIALRIVEDAWCDLDAYLGQQERSRKVYKRRLGFRKWDLDKDRRVPSRPVYTKIKLSQAQTLQWLVYDKSESRERDTEIVDSYAPPTQEDMIVRYIKHLVFITMKNSFHVTVGVGQLLYRYGKREIRLMYDILVQEDDARKKSEKYIDRQRTNLMDKLHQRFDGVIQPVMATHPKNQFLTQPVTEPLKWLVNECLQRFMPWDTNCVVGPRTTLADVPELRFSGTNPAKEDLIEMNRVHTISHPPCFSQFVKGLSRLVRGLPPDALDKDCDYGPPEERLAVPQFRHVSEDQPRGDRYRPPTLEPEEYLRLEQKRTRQARRRKGHKAHQLRIYVDHVERVSFDPRQSPQVQLDLDPATDLIEVRGQDDEGEVLLAGLIVCADAIPPGGSFRDSVVLGGGQEITIQLTPIQDAAGEVDVIRAEVEYAESGVLRILSRLAEGAWFSSIHRAKGQREGASSLKLNLSWLGRVAIAAALVIVIVAFVWFQRRPLDLELPTPPRLARPPVPEIETGSPASPLTPAKPTPRPGVAPVLIARAAWSSDPEAALRAVRIEPTRGEPARIDLSRRLTTLLVSLPAEDEAGRSFSRYRVTLVSGEKVAWQQVLLAPPATPNQRRRIVRVDLMAQRLSENQHHRLQVEGRGRDGWHSLGHLELGLTTR